MAEIKNVHLMEDIPSAELEKLEKGALMHRQYSGITFKVMEYDSKKAVIQVAQAKHVNENYFDKKRLIEITHETFDKFLGRKIHVQPIPYAPSPVEKVDSNWVRKKMLDNGIKLKDMVGETGLNKTQLSPLINDSKPLSQVTKAMLYYYFAYKESISRYVSLSMK